MKTLAYGTVDVDGLSVFQSVATLDDEDRLVVTFHGAMRIANPYRYLSSYIDELNWVLPQNSFASSLMDFTQMRFINDNCFYVIMDICDAVYNLVPGAVVVRRREDDEWQREALPILLNLNEPPIAERTTFQDVRVP